MFTLVNMVGPGTKKEGFVQIDWLYGSIHLLGILPLDQKSIRVNKEASSDLTGLGGL